MRTSSIHALQSSTTREKLLKSVQALRPFLFESLRKSSFDLLDSFNVGDTEHLTYLQALHYGNEKDSLIQHQNSGNLQSPTHSMSAHDQARDHDQVHIIYEESGGNRTLTDQHVNHVNEGHDAAHIHRQYDPVECKHDAIMHDEDNGFFGYANDDFYTNDLAVDECTAYGDEGNRPDSSANMPELSTNIPDMLCSLEPSVCLQGMSSFTSLDFSSQNECRFPTAEPFQQPTLHPQNLYLYDPHFHSQQAEFQDYLRCRDIINGAAASVYNIDLSAHEARCIDNAINQLPIASTPLILSAASAEAQESMEAVCSNMASSPPSQQRKKQRTKPLPDASTKKKDNCDNCNYPNAAKSAGFSSNLACERKRRRKINEALYALRAMVPNVSKMDKASIMSDAITYAKQLRKRVDDMQDDIHKLHVDPTSIDEHVQEESSGNANKPTKGMGLEEYIDSLPKHKILELDVFNMENDIYHLHICCEKGPGDLLKLTRVIEALNFDILNTSVASVGDQSTINAVVKVDVEDVLKPEKVKEKMLDIVNKYGLHV